ncbi:MAG: hypothetical protein IJ604_11295 [Prevotella sp.]|nr:hypothetical protein [Prevotella sp.]MBR1463940.1 hypothetical protein [Prevotella sp.]
MLMCFAIAASPIAATNNYDGVNDDDVPKSNGNHNESPSEKVSSIYNSTSRILMVSFHEEMEDVTVLVYKDGMLVDTVYVGDVSCSDTNICNLWTFGAGSYTVYVTEGNFIEYYCTVEVN